MHTILNAATEVGRPTLFSMLIIIAAHIPIFTLQRHEGRIFAPMAYSVTSALIASLIFSLTLVPLLCYLLLRKRVAHEENRLVLWCKKIYRPALEWSLDHRKIVVAAAIGAFALSLVAATRLGTEFLPELNEGSIWINVPLHPSLSVSEARSEMHRIRASIAHIPEINTIVYKAGRPEDGTDPKLISMAEILVDLKPESEWKRKVTKQDIMHEMEQAIRQAARHAGELLASRSATTSSKASRRSTARSSSRSSATIWACCVTPGSRFLAAIADVPGVARAMIDRQGELPQELIEIDRAQAARYGLNIGDIQDVIETALGGREATRIWEGERKFAVVVRLRQNERSLTQLRDILLTTQSGTFIIEPARRT